MGIMMIHRLSSLMLLLSASMGMLTLGFGCNAPNFDPKLATRPYPFDLHTTDVVPIQVFRDGTTIEIVNSTDRTWSMTIWVNQRCRSIEITATGQRVSMDLFHSETTSWWPAPRTVQTRPAAKVELIEIQEAEGMPMISMISIMTGENE